MPGPQIRMPANRKSKFEMMEQARRREQVPKPELPPDGYTEIAAPFGGHGLMDLKNMLLAVLLFVFYGLAAEYAGTHPFLNSGEELFVVFLLTVLTCCAAIRIYRRVYFGYHIYLPEDSPGMVVYNWYWGRRFFLCTGSRLMEAAYPSAVWNGMRCEMMKSVSTESLFIPEPMSPYKALMIKGCPLGASSAKRRKTNFK